MSRDAVHEVELTTKGGVEQIRHEGRLLASGADVIYRAALVLAAAGVTGLMRVYRTGSRTAVTSVPIAGGAS